MHVQALSPPLSPPRESLLAGFWILNQYDRCDSVSDILRKLNWKTLENRQAIARPAVVIAGDSLVKKARGWRASNGKRVKT